MIDIKVAVLTGLSEEANVLAYPDPFHPGLLVLTGLKALANLDALVPKDCKAIISWGTAGAVVPEMQVGSVAALVRVHGDGGKVYLPDLEWIAPHHQGISRGYRYHWIF